MCIRDRRNVAQLVGLELPAVLCEHLVAGFQVPLDLEAGIAAAQLIAPPVQFKVRDGGRVLICGPLRFFLDKEKKTNCTKASSGPKGKASGTEPGDEAPQP